MIVKLNQHLNIKLHWYLSTTLQGSLKDSEDSGLSVVKGQMSKELTICHILEAISPKDFILGINVQQHKKLLMIQVADILSHVTVK